MSKATLFQNQPCLKSVSSKEEGPSTLGEAIGGLVGHRGVSVAFSGSEFKLTVFPILNKVGTNRPPSAGSVLQVASS